MLGNGGWCMTTSAATASLMAIGTGQIRGAATDFFNKIILIKWADF